MTKFDRGTQKVHGKLSKLSLGYMKGIPFFLLSIKRYIKVTEKVQNIVPFLYLISVWDGTLFSKKCRVSSATYNVAMVTLPIC